jgi:hypothetical protein
LTGAAIEVPMLAITLWVIANVWLGDGEAEFMQIVRLTTVFAGFAAILTAGGIGRLAAYSWVEGGRRRAIYVAARAHAIASAGLIVIATIPHGHFPATPWGWVALAVIGLVPGALCGAIIGFVCSGVSNVALADVLSRPGGALRQLIDPKDLVKLGTALRTRTSTLFEGVFEPAPPPPPGDQPAAEATAEPPHKPAPRATGEASGAAPDRVDGT